MADPAPLEGRKGARRRSEIPPHVLAALDRGETETVNLVEWLAVDHATLLEHALAPFGGDVRAKLVASARNRSEDGIKSRIETTGVELGAALRDDDEALTRLSAHRSDVVRAWCAYARIAAPDLGLGGRLDRMRVFAADTNMSVRECAWLAGRPWVVEEMESALRRFSTWVLDADQNVRRCAVEGTRPRGVWCRHSAWLKDDPARGFALLEPLRSDPSRYVQNAVANWLNDASKSRPELVEELCARWERESDTKETAYIVRRALRTLRR